MPSPAIPCQAFERMPVDEPLPSEPNRPPPAVACPPRIPLVGKYPSQNAKAVIETTVLCPHCYQPLVNDGKRVYDVVECPICKHFFQMPPQVVLVYSNDAPAEARKSSLIWRMLPSLLLVFLIGIFQFLVAYGILKLQAGHLLP
jgi:hypothetical protein